MHRHDSPGSLHHELHGKPTNDKEREAWRKNPEGNEDYSEDGSQNNRTAAAPFLRQMTNHCSAADCTNSVNDPSRGLLRHAIVALFAEKRLIHVLSPMRHGVECCHQQNDVKKENPVAFEYSQQIAPKITRLALPLQPNRRFRHLRTDVQHQKCG